MTSIKAGQLYDGDPKNDQAVFLHAYCHLLNQNCQSVTDSPGNNCRYRGPNGLMCAAGPFIREEDYSEELETCIFVDANPPEIYDAAGKYFLSRGFNVKLLHSLQQVHDGYPPDRWEEMLKDVANHYGLWCPEFDEETIRKSEQDIAAGRTLSTEELIAEIRNKLQG